MRLKLMRIRPIFTLRSIAKSCDLVARLYFRPENPQRNAWEFAIATFGDGLSDVDAAKITRLCEQKRPYKLLLSDSLTISFPQKTSLTFPHIDLPIETGMSGVGVEITGELSDDVLQWLWTMLTTTNVGFTNDFEKSFVYHRATADDLGSARRLESMAELKRWIVEVVGSRSVY